MSSSEDDERAYQPILLDKSNELNYELFVEDLHQPQGFEPNNIEEDLVYAEEALADKENNINVENIPSVEPANNVVTPPPTGSFAPTTDLPDETTRPKNVEAKRNGFFGIQHNTLLEIFATVKYMEMPAPQYLKSIERQLIAYFGVLISSVGDNGLMQISRSLFVRISETIWKSFSLPNTSGNKVKVCKGMFLSTLRLRTERGDT